MQWDRYLWFLDMRDKDKIEKYLDRLIKIHNEILIESEKSRYIINKPWDSIPVYIDNNNSKKYWVDTTLSYHWFLYARELMKWKAKESASLINNSK